MDKSGLYFCKQGQTVYFTNSKLSQVARIWSVMGKPQLRDFFNLTPGLHYISCKLGNLRVRRFYRWYNQGFFLNGLESPRRRNVTKQVNRLWLLRGIGHIDASMNCFLHRRTHISFWMQHKPKISWLIWLQLWFI